MWAVMSTENEPESWNRRALSKVFAALNRADELGGEVRDFLVERYQQSDRAQGVVKKIQELRGKSFKTASEERSERESAAAEAAAVAPPPSASVTAEKKGLGDPGIAAQIYGRSSCPWSGRAIRLLEDRKVDYDFIDLDDSDHSALDVPLVHETKQNSVPYVFLRGQFIGGFNALSEVDRLGQLEVAVMSAEERAADPRLAAVEIAPRPNTDENAPAEVEDPPGAAE
jgi:glutaredoxin 3